MKLHDRQSGWAKRLDRKIGVVLVFLLGCARPFLKLFNGALPTKPRFLLIKLSALGDVVVMMPALRLIQNRFPHAEFVFLGSPANREIVESLPMPVTFEAFSLGTLGRLRDQRFTAVFDFDQWVRASAVVTALMKTPLSVGFRSRGQHRHFAYDAACSLTTQRHMGENFWNLAKLGLEKQGIQITSSFEEDKTKVQQEWRSQFLSVESGPLSSKYVVIHPGCGENGMPRQWPVESWKALITTLHGEYKAEEILITGHGEYERDLAGQIAQAGARSIAGEMDFRQLMAVLAGASKVFSSNTGIMHLASFLGGRVVVLNGPTSRTLWGPLWGGLSLKSPTACSPCLTWGNDYGCSDPICVKIITPKRVFEASHA